MTATLKQQVGKRAEQFAYEFLTQQGFKLIAQNYSSAPGEIDLIMQDGDDIVFIEVRERNHLHFGSAIESINYRKQQKIIKTAIIFLRHKNLLNKVNCRFDVVGIDQNKVEWIKDAFSADCF